MNVMNQAMVYIQTDNKLDLIISVNITSMMVLASMYLSVASSLPSTTNIKPIEIWLLFNMMYPVFVILSNVILQVDSNHFIWKSVIYKIDVFQNIQEESKGKVVPMMENHNKKYKTFKWVVYYFLPLGYVIFSIIYTGIYVMY